MIHQSNEYYVEIDKRIRLDFPHKFDTNRSNLGEGSTKPVQTVARRSEVQILVARL
jgi:hypothetical protein